MTTQFAKHDVVVFNLPDSTRTYEVAAFVADSCRDNLTGKVTDMSSVRIWPTDPADDYEPRWVSASLLKLAEHCPDHCPRCGMDLKVEGYPQGHQNDEGDPCEWSWSLRQAVSDDLNR